jgi:pimeloyl-ACP methyl ester carboxylesterase
MIAKPLRLSAAIVLTILLSSCSPYTWKRSYLREAAMFTEAPARPVIVISGFGTSKLYDPITKRYVWGTAHATLQTKYADNLELAVDPEKEEIVRDRLVPRGFVGSRGPINFSWQISRALELYGSYAMATLDPPAMQPPRDIYRFAYDWRLSSTDNARELDALIEQIRRAHHNPQLRVDIVGHSLGAFIALTYLRMGTAPLDQPDLWTAAAESAARKVNAVVLLGAPQQGAVDAFRVLIRSERFVMRVLAPRWTATYPSVVEMLPLDGRIVIDEQGAPMDIDLWDIQSWRRHKLSIFSDEIRRQIVEQQSEKAYDHLTVAFAKSLRRAKTLRTVHARPLPPGVAVTSITSDCIPTGRRVLLRRDGTFAFQIEDLRENEKHLAKRMFVPGDGSITMASATAGKVMVFCSGHQGMALDPGVHHTIIRSLQGTPEPALAAH